MCTIVAIVHLNTLVVNHAFARWVDIGTCHFVFFQFGFTFWKLILAALVVIVFTVGYTWETNIAVAFGKHFHYFRQRTQSKRSCLLLRSNEHAVSTHNSLLIPLHGVAAWPYKWRGDHYALRWVQLRHQFHFTAGFMFTKLLQSDCTDSFPLLNLMALLNGIHLKLHIIL